MDVIPAQAGIHLDSVLEKAKWIPACAGMTTSYRHRYRPNADNRAGVRTERATTRTSSSPRMHDAAAAKPVRLTERIPRQGEPFGLTGFRPAGIISGLCRLPAARRCRRPFPLFRSDLL